MDDRYCHHRWVIVLIAGVVIVFSQNEWVAKFHLHDKRNSGTIQSPTSNIEDHVKDFKATFDESYLVINPYTEQSVSSRYGTNYLNRSQRFPNAEERLMVYLSNWYMPPCHREDSSAIHFTNPYIKNERRGNIDKQPFNTIDVYSMDNSGSAMTWDVNDDVGRDFIFFLNTKNMLDAASDVASGLTQSYSHDIVESLMPAMKRIEWKKDDPPILLQFGDGNHCVNHRERETIDIPIIKKFRYSIDPQDLQRIASNNDYTSNCTSDPREIPFTASLTQSLQPIIWKLNTRRHYGLFSEVDRLDVIPYTQKRNIAVFRGASSGHHHWLSKFTDEQNCRKTPRCNIVISYYNSSIIDARISGKSGHNRPSVIEVQSNNGPAELIQKGRNAGNAARSNKSQTSTNMIDLYGSYLSLEDLLKYKVLIMIEGNDVSSGLKWALYSSSVVVMPYPATATSWAMEELLEPWVHFVPVKQDLSDLEFVVNWIFSHEEEAQYISLRARLWIEDLLFHPDAAKEEEYIQNETLKRYRANFRKAS
jgi:Glycosyl transferase family 90